MAYAATTSLTYLPIAIGQTQIKAAFDVIFAGDDLYEGNILVGMQIDVDPTIDTPITINQRVADAVRAKQPLSQTAKARSASA